LNGLDFAPSNKAGAFTLSWGATRIFRGSPEAKKVSQKLLYGTLKRPKQFTVS